MKGVIAPLYVRSIDEMDVAEICELLEISTDDIKERFSDKLTELGLDKSHVEYYDDDGDDTEITIDDLYDELDGDNELYYDEYDNPEDADD
jgi:hypothetical protein